MVDEIGGIAAKHATPVPLRAPGVFSVNTNIVGIRCCRNYIVLQKSALLISTRRRAVSTRRTASRNGGTTWLDACVAVELIVVSKD
jgi:hypothetical protein